jgi:hypothetical protein
VTAVYAVNEGTRLPSSPSATPAHPESGPQTRV